MNRITALLFFFLGFATFIRAEVTVTVGKIDDRRSSGDTVMPASMHPANGYGMQISLKIAGPELAASKGFRLDVGEIVDNTGKCLWEPWRHRDIALISATGKKFEPLVGENGYGAPTKESGGLLLAIANPPRAAKSFRMTGYLEVLLPARDPKSAIVANLSSDVGKPLVNDALKAVGVGITFAPMVGNRISFALSDPTAKMGMIEFFAADGTILQTSSWSSLNFGDSQTNNVTLDTKSTGGLTAKIYLITEKSLLRIPLPLGNIALP